MKLRNLIFPVMLVLLLGASVCYAAAPIEIRALGRNQFHFIATVDVVTIQDVIVNRGSGNSIISPAYREDLPVTLKFGDQWYVLVLGAAVREFEVRTDKKNWTFTFK